MKYNTVKKVIAVASAVIMSMSSIAIPASAAWKTTESGVKWTDSNGKYVKSKWLTMKNGNKYYIKSNGCRATGLLSMKIKGKKVYYYFNKDGVMQIGWQKIGSKYYYFQKSGKAVTSSKVKIGSYSYQFSSTGVWNGKVWNGKKDVTSKVDIAKLTGIKSAAKETNKNGVTAYEDLFTTTKSSEELIKELGPIPKTVTILGQKVSTNVKYLPLKFDYRKFNGATDADLENLKYLTKLETLELIPVNITKETWFEDYKDLKFAGKANIKITHINFCLYMPNLKDIAFYSCGNLTDVSGLRNCKNLETFYMTDCKSIKDIDSLKDVPITKEIDLSFSGVDGVFEGWDFYKDHPECAYMYMSMRTEETQKKANLMYDRDARYGVIDNDWSYTDWTGYVFE